MFIEERVIRIINLNGWKSKRQYNNAVSTEAVPGHLSIQKTKKKHSQDLLPCDIS